MTRYVLSIVMLLGGARLYAQDPSNEPLWIKLMLDPQPNYYRVKAAFNDYWKDSVPTRGYGYKVFKRWEWRALQHINEQGDVVWPQGQLRDLLGSNQNGNGLNSGNTQQGSTGGGSFSACPSSGRWSPVGPIRHPYNQTGQPTGIGRVSGIAFHPKDSNTVFLCAPQGGLWKTIDNGQTWNMLFGNGPAVNTIGTNSLVLSYNNADTMYLGTGDRDAGDAPGFGVLASWNGGKTWVARNSGMGNLTVGRIIMHPTNSAILLASTNSGIYRSTNSGGSWSQTLSGSSWDVVFHPKNPALVYAAIGGLFYRSADGGASWSNITSGLPTSGIYRSQIAVSPVTRGYVYFLITTSGSLFHGLYRSTDSGSNFSTMSTTPNILGYSETGSDANGQGWYDLDLAADPKNNGVIYVGGVNIWRSSNGGANWTIMGHWVGSGGADDIHADQHALEFNITGNKLFAGNDGGIYYSTNAGSRWVNVSSGVQSSQIYRLSQAKTDPFAGAQGYQDNGSSQTQEDEFYTYYGGDGMDCQVDPGDHTYVYGSYIYGKIYRAINKNTIVTIGANGTNGINENGGWITPFILREGNPSVMWAGYANVWRCDNVKSTGTISWTKLSTGWAGTITRLENSPADNKLLFVIRGDGRLLKSTDATVTTPTWTDLSGSQPSGVRYVEAHHKNSNIVYACNATNLYRSTNQGTSWTSLGTLPSGSGNMNCLYHDTSAKTETIYIGSEKGVFVWDSASGSMVSYQSGFPIWSDVTDMDIYYSPKGKGYHRLTVSTYGMGVWRTNLYDNGSGKPKAGFYAFDSVFATGGSLRLYENIQYGTSSVKWKITPHNYTYQNGTDSLSNNPVVLFSKKGIYNVQLIATNCNGNDTFSKQNWVRVYDAPPAPNCRNTTTWQSVNYAMGIMKFSLADNKNETGGYFDDGQNLDETNRKVFRLKPSTTYSATIKTGLYNSEYARIYLDYNNNGKFENYLGEVSTLSSSVVGSRNISFTTPSTLKANQCLRIRVISDYNTLDTNACKNLNYGQGEDYTFVYERTSPLYKVSKTNPCAYENITFTDTSEGLVAKYEWDFGSGAVPATAVGVGPHTVYYTATGNKNVRLRINGSDSLRKNNYISVGNGPVPQVVVKTGASAGCEGRSLTLAARTTNGSSFTTQWQLDEVDISGKTDSLLTLNNITPAETGKYRAVLTNGGCTATSGVVTVGADPKPTPAYTINTNPQCFRYHKFNFTNGSSIGSGSISQTTWKLGDGTTQTTSNASKTYAAAGAYSVKLICTSDKGCKDSIAKTATINTNGIPKFTVNDSDQCVSGNNFVFSNASSVPTGSLTYLWQFGDGNTSSTTSPTKSYSAKGIYTVNLISTTNNGCKDTISKPLRVYSKPTVSFSTNNTEQCLRYNNFTTTNSTSNTDGSLAYKWTFGDGFSSTATTPAHGYSTSGGYNLKLVATSTYGCKDSGTIGLTVNPQGNLKVGTNDSDQCLSGNSFVFTNSSSIATGTLSYAWQFGDGNSSSSVSPTHSYSVKGIYSVLLVSTSNKSCKDSLTKKIRVYSQPQVAFTVNSNSQCLRGNNFITTNSSSNTDGSLTYKWTFGDGFSASATSPAHSYAADGSYNLKLVATSTYGCRDSIAQNMTVNPQGNLKADANDTDQCLSGNSFAFNNTSSIAKGSLTYAWQFGDGNTSNSASPTHSYLVRGIYSVLMVSTSDKNCKDSLTKKLRVYSQPKADFSIGNSAQCLQGNNFVCTNTSSNSDGSLSYSWTAGSGKSTAQNWSISYSASGAQSIQLAAVSSFGCADSLTRSVTVYAQPDLQVSVNDDAQCLQGNSFVFSNNSNISTGSMSYSWTFGDNTQSSDAAPVKSYSGPGTYDVQVVANSNYGCKDTASLELLIQNEPVAAFATNKPEQCLQGNNFVFTNQSTISNGNFTSYWYYGDGNTDVALDGQNNYASDGNYNILLVTVSASGCADSVVQNITVYPKADVQFSINRSGQCLYGNTFELTNNSTAKSGSIDGYEWRFGDGSTSTFQTPNYTYTTYGKYVIELVVFSNGICADSAEKNVQVYAQPVAGISVNSNLTSCLKYNQFSLTANNAISEGTVTTIWNNGDGSEKTGSNNVHSYAESGSYQMKMVAVSNFGCRDSLLKTIVVLPTPKVAFSPTKTLACEQEPIVLYNNSDIASGSFISNWKLGDGRTSSADTTTVSYAKYGIYKVQLEVVSDQNCKDTLIKSIEIASTPKARFSLNKNSGCAGQTEFVLKEASTNADGRQMTSIWIFDNSDTASGNRIKKVFENAGTHEVKLVSSTTVCADDTMEYIYVSPAVRANFSHYFINEETARFMAEDSGDGTYEYTWYFGDGNTAAGRNATHTYSLNKHFDPQLIVSNDKGCSDTSGVGMKVISPNNLEVDNSLNFYIYPNPSNGKFTYKFELKEERTVEVDLFDLLGQSALYSKVWQQLQPGIYYETIDMNELGLAPGAYPLVIKSNEDKLVVKVIFAR